MSAALADRDALLVDLRAQVAALSPGAGLVVASPRASPDTSIRATPLASATSSRSLEGLLFSAHTPRGDPYASPAFAGSLRVSFDEQALRLDDSPPIVAETPCEYAVPRAFAPSPCVDASLFEQTPVSAVAPRDAAALPLFADTEPSPRELARATRALMPRPALPNFESPQHVGFLETPKSKRLVHFAPQLIVASPNKENTSTPHPPTSRRVRSPIKADVEQHAKFIAFRRRAAVRSPRGVYTSENPEHVSPTDEDRAEARARLIAAALAEAPET
mmetsp:Transcript_6551/g.20644  ORF Transcript_6551/g.20644 Transcript_6551/m.20644 type:complete len:275 (-) Transcript_6551:92-916(-)